MLACIQTVNLCCWALLEWTEITALNSKQWPSSKGAEVHLKDNYYTLEKIL